MKTSLVFVLFISFLITMLSLEVPSKESFNTSLVSYNPTPFKLEGDSILFPIDIFSLSSPEYQISFKERTLVPDTFIIVL